LGVVVIVVIVVVSYLILLKSLFGINIVNDVSFKYCYCRLYMKRLERQWMYDRVDGNKRVKQEFINGVLEFLKHAKQQDEFKRIGKLRCPCIKCKNLNYLNERMVRIHLAQVGFQHDYYHWVCHGEEYSDVSNPYLEMVNDALRDRIDGIREDALI
jgi:hypothetical protein